MYVLFEWRRDQRHMRGEVVPIYSWNFHIHSAKEIHLSVVSGEKEVHKK